MASGVCVTSFRMFMRHSDINHLSRNLRLTPVAATFSMNTWNLSGRGYCSKKKNKDSDSGETNIEKATTATTTTRQSNEESEYENYVQHSNKASVSNEFGKKAIGSSSLNSTAPTTTVSLVKLSEMKITELKSKLRSHGLTVKGSKEILINRLHSYLQQHQQEEDIKRQYTALSSPKNTQPSDEDEMSTDDEGTTSTTTTTPSTTTLPQLENKNDGNPNYTTKPKVIAEDHDVSVEYIQGLPHLTVPLPSRNEKCRFALKPVSHKVGDLIEMLKEEDRGIDRATVLNKSGVRIASTCNIESLMDEPFWLQINDQEYKVVPPKRERIKSEDLDKLGDIRALVAQLYEALHVGEYHIKKEKELTEKLEHLKYKITPMERQKAELSIQADRKINIMTWVGLGLMSVQFGILARLTWWEYSWDIMEPVTYFVTYGTVMAMYAYYCVTKTEYNLDDVKNRQYLITVHKRAKKKNFDIDEYNSLRREIAEIEYDLRRLRDPLNLQLPPHVDRAQHGPPATPTRIAATTLANTVESSKKATSGFKIPFLDSKN